MPNYPRVTPATLPNYSAVINDPQDTELANKLAQVDLQTRRFVYDFLTTVFDNTSILLPAALGSATLAGLVLGSTSNSGSQQGIVQGTVSTPDLRDQAVATAKLADAAVTTAKIAAAAIVSSLIANNAITSALIAAGAVGTTQLAAQSVDNTILKSDVTGVAGAVTTDHIRSLQVTAAKIAANVIGGGQLILGASAGQILVTGSTPFALALQTVTGDATLDGTGKITLIANGVVEVEERTGLNVAGGGSSATTWNVRGTTIGWVKTFDTLSSSFLTISGAQLGLAAGKYIIEVTVPGYTVGLHQVRIDRYNSSNVSQEIVYGSSETAGASMQTRSGARGMMTFATGDYFQIEHYTTSAVATNGLGIPVNATGGLYEIYARVKIQKIG